MKLVKEIQTIPQQHRVQKTQTEINIELEGIYYNTKDGEFIKNTYIWRALES